MRRVIIESPYAGNINDNTAYLKRCLRDSIDRGEAPLASHLLYPFVLREDLKDERQLGIELGYEWWYGARAIIFYIDRGWSSGMLDALEKARRSGKDIEYRYLDLGTIKLETGGWLGRLKDFFFYKPPVLLSPPARQEAKPSAKKWSKESWEREHPKKDEGSFINQTLARDAPSPVPFGEAKEL